MANPRNLDDYFQLLPERILSENTGVMKARFHFQFNDSQHPGWTVDIDGPSCSVTRGLEGTADCVVTTTEDVYLGIEQGTKDPQMAFMMGKVKVSSIPLMLRYTKAFRRLS
ncbi:MAG: SCP2 sterol-binding domain-containing protein [Thermoanaerobaculia bacterium]